MRLLPIMGIPTKKANVVPPIQGAMIRSTDSEMFIEGGVPMSKKFLSLAFLSLLYNIRPKNARRKTTAISVHVDETKSQAMRMPGRNNRKEALGKGEDRASLPSCLLYSISPRCARTKKPRQRKQKARRDGHLTVINRK